VRLKGLSFRPELERHLALAFAAGGAVINTVPAPPFLNAAAMCLPSGEYCKQSNGLCRRKDAGLEQRLELSVGSVAALSQSWSGMGQTRQHVVGAGRQLVPGGCKRQRRDQAQRTNLGGQRQNRPSSEIHQQDGGSALILSATFAPHADGHPCDRRATARRGRSAA